VDAVPVEMKERLFIGAAVPQLASLGGEVSSAARIVVCHVTAPARNGPPGGPVGRAKGLLDALHDNRQHGPFYRDLGVSPPLVDDDPAHVGVLAVEVTPGRPRTQYMIGTELRLDGQFIASVPMRAAAPNDIAGGSGEQARISAARLLYGKAVRAGFARHTALLAERPGAVVIRHRHQRDADKTWRTWITAICGAGGAGQEHWAAGAPLAGWRPAAVASVLDTGIDTPVLYELWAERPRALLRPLSSSTPLIRRKFGPIAMA
jgi:hypothetical protein